MNEANQIKYGGIILSSDKTMLIKADNTESFHIPNGIKVICRNAFKDANNIRILNIPESVEEVENFAFSELKIESVLIPSSIKNGEKASSFYVIN